jgi:hypothetical protein
MLSSKLLCFLLCLQLCAHQQLEPRALCSVLHSLAHLLTAQQQQQPPPLVAAGVPPQEALSSQQQLQQQATQSNAGGLPAPLLLQLLKETQRALQATAAPTAVEPNRSVAQHVQLSEEADGSMQQLQMQRNLARAPHAGHQQLDHRQQQAWMHGQQHHQQGLTPAGLVMLTDALRQLKTDPPQEWQAAYVAAAQQLMNTSDARNLPLMLAPCVRWQHAPGPAWLQQYLAACECLLPNMQAQVGPLVPQGGVLVPCLVAFVTLDDVFMRCWAGWVLWGCAEQPRVMLCSPAYVVCMHWLPLGSYWKSCLPLKTYVGACHTSQH